MAKYIKVLQKALNQPAIKNCGMSRNDIVHAIAGISDQLRGPMSNEERLLLVADRSEFRATLALLDKQPVVVA
jgi:hypothetical protein